MNQNKNIEDIYPLSPMQQGILFHTLLSPDSGEYIPQVCLTLTGLLKIELFKQAWEQVITRHQSLRASFHWERREQPFQVIYRQVNLPLYQQDWRNLSADEQQQLLENFLKTDRQHNFNLKKPPLIRLNLIQLTDNIYKLIWTQHHLILDGWSAGLVIKEVLNIYISLLEEQSFSLPKSPPYGEYIAWLSQQDLSTAHKFWKEQLKGFTTPTSLRIEKNLNSISHTNQPEEQQVKLSKPTTSALQLFVQKNKLTLNTIIQGAFAILLSRYSGEEDILFGATSSGRPVALTGVESMVGLFINTLPVRIKVPGQAVLISWLNQLQNQQSEALQYEYTSLLEIQKWSDIPAGLPLFKTILVFENYPIDKTLIQQDKTLNIQNVDSVEWTNFPLTILVGLGSELSIKVKYSCHLFEPTTINQFLEHFSILLQEIITHPEQRLGEFNFLTTTEKQQLLIDWNNTQVDYPETQCIHELFQAQVEQNPDAIAIVVENQYLTYHTLNYQSNQLAHYLQNLGITSESFVGVCVERSPEMLIAILAILKAGGAYVPLDPSYPQDRLEFVLKDAKVSTVLISSHLLDKISHTKAEIITLDNTLQDKISEQPSLNPITNTTPQNSIYVIYTSGSTGQPKGVINTHHGLHNRLLWMQNTYQLTPSDRILQKTPFSFDVSVWEFFWPLLNGACLVMAKPEGHKDSHYLVKLIIAQQITTLHFVPSMLQAFLEEKDLKQCKSIQQVFCSGEALTLELQNLFFKHFDAELHNLYGPTEAAIDVTAWTCIRDSKLSTVPIGYPIANTQIYILDSHLQPVPIGVPGELHIGGVGLARGYYNRPELTAEKFIPNPFNYQKTSDRLYKTGDLVRYLADGNIEYLGRLDYQVKIRGLRIELGEIETVLNQHPDIKACRVIAQNYHLNDQYIVAYIILQEPLSTLEQLNQKLQDFLAEKLPDYMIPSHFITLDQFPLTPSGKLDQQSLPKLENINQKTSVYVAPQNPIEEKIVIIWQEVLKLEKIGIYDNFFELGGHSLLATRVNSRLREAFKMDIPLRTLFEKPTVYSLAERISTMQITIQQFSPSDSIQKGNRKEMEI
ncbi:amino acid adenylation domain-containing protein [Limnoraphis robusta]|uniref:Amino acid adenylation domain-containing protein n=1 Tax=Limnoraphis robusta CCNP1315 TaxID=3110306 RepID=A0ABU5TSP6_9CYAN|nr:amino acid adenylation domain-containing protein [Limnoraphis robusta]MEA5517927.1 amino acid adenylation domain-containing protein [Limnoraphis robusta CCNP1315]MEA5543732.1 amino acid adenylation domain-containing protein [Limnoraphis robusta CCNP1324]